MKVLNSMLKGYRLPDIEFKNRESVLIKLYKEDYNVRSIYNIVIIFFTIFVFTILVKEFFQERRLIPTPFTLIYIGFGKLDLVFLIWVTNNLFTVLMYYGFLAWGKIRKKVKTKKCWDNFCIIVLVTYNIVSFCVITYVINKLNMPFASAMILSMESIRFLFKIHAFVRFNAIKILKTEPETQSQIENIPSLSIFLYFLYAPTTIYRDDYPRRESIRWSFVVYRALEVIGVIFLFAFGFEYIARPMFKDTCIKKLTLLDLFVLSLQFSIPATLTLWAMFFVLEHSSQNLVGELLRFGDRMFYQDWWTATEAKQFYKRWNILVGNWVYTYVYKDMRENLSPHGRNKFLSRFTTMMISAFVHEWVVLVSTGFNIPVISFSLAMAALLQYNAKEKTYMLNMLGLALITLGSGFGFMLFSLEYFARENLNSRESFMPVFLTHNCLIYDIYAHMTRTVRWDIIITIMSYLGYIFK